MYDTQYIDSSKLTASELCDFLESAFYAEIRQLLESIQESIDQLSRDENADSHIELFVLLYLKLKDEILQMIRNDKLIIFPLIRNDEKEIACPAHKLPLEMIQGKHKKIMQLMEKIRQQANNFLPKPDWQPTFITCCTEMFKLEQELFKTIYTWENALLKKVNTEFNQPCSGNCHHSNK